MERLATVVLVAALLWTTPLLAGQFGPGLPAARGIDPSAGADRWQRFGPAARVTRPAPPLVVRQPATVVVVEPSYAIPAAVSQTIIVSTPPSSVPASRSPFYCFLDGAGFDHVGLFVGHLHSIHGVPLGSAVSSSSLVEDGQLVYFGP